jgi:hypothetical protein
MAKQSYFQFGIGRLMILTSAIAVVMAISIRIDAPQIAQWAFTVSLALMVAWMVMRGPGVYAKIIEARNRRRKGEQRRNELEAEATELRRNGEIADSGDETNNVA